MTTSDGGAALPLRDQLAVSEKSEPPWEFKHENPEPFPDPPENWDEIYHRLKSATTATDEDRQTDSEWRATEQAWSCRDRLMRIVQWRYTVADAMIAARDARAEG